MTDALDNTVDEQLAVDGGTSTRRTVLRGMAIVGVVAGSPVLAACGDDGEGDTTGGTGNENTDDGNSGGGGGDDSAEQNDDTNDDTNDDGGDDGNGGNALAQTSQIDVGGGMILEDEELVITQPEEGTFVGLSATCTHRGCLLSDVTDGAINCASSCGHGSKFDLNGAVVNGPATSPLEEVPLQVDGENIMPA